MGDLARGPSGATCRLLAVSFRGGWRRASVGSCRTYNGRCATGGSRRLSAPTRAARGAGVYAVPGDRYPSSFRPNPRRPARRGWTPTVRGRLAASSTTSSAPASTATSNNLSSSTGTPATPRDAPPIPRDAAGRAQRAAVLFERGPQSAVRFLLSDRASTITPTPPANFLRRRALPSHRLRSYRLHLWTRRRRPSSWACAHLSARERDVPGATVSAGRFDNFCELLKLSAFASFPPFLWRMLAHFSGRPATGG